jgi:hypothetical protein
VKWQFHLSVVFFHEAMFLIGGIIIGMTIMFFVVDRFEKRMIDRHMRQVDGLLGRINELAKNQRVSEPASERPPSPRSSAGGMP